MQKQGLKLSALVMTATMLINCVGSTSKEETIIKEETTIKDRPTDAPIPKYSDLEIIRIAKNHLAYYCPNAKRRNFECRKVSDNIYDIRFERISTDKFITNKQWNFSVHRITLLANDKYNIDYISGAICF